MTKESIHHLKVWPRYYDALANGDKRWEVRLNDRGFAVDHLLVFHKWDPKAGAYRDGPLLYAKVMHIEEDVPGLMEGYVIMDITEVRQS